MKNVLIRISSRLAVVMGLAIILTGAAFAQAVSVNPKVDYTAIEKVRSQARLNAKTQTQRAKTLRPAKGKNTSASNQANFSIGTNFIFAVLTAPSFDQSKEDFTYAVEDLVYLIQSLEGEPEAETLKKTLKSVMENTASSEQVLKDIIDVSKSYSARLNKEQRWYFVSGITITNLYIDVLVRDNAAISKSLTQVQSLIAQAPPGTSQEIIGSMQNLVNYVSQTTFAADDYVALVGGIEDVSKSIFA